MEIGGSKSYGFIDPIWGGEIEFFFIKKRQNLRCCIHQVIGCGEALVAVGFFLGCAKCLFKGGPYNGNLDRVSALEMKPG